MAITAREVARWLSENKSKLIITHTKPVTYTTPNGAEMVRHDAVQFDVSGVNMVLYGHGICLHIEPRKQEMNNAGKPTGIATNPRERGGGPEPKGS